MINSEAFKSVLTQLMARMRLLYRGLLSPQIQIFSVTLNKFTTKVTTPKDREMALTVVVL